MNLLSRLMNRWSSGTDNFTRTPSMMYVPYVGNEREIWLTIDGKEFHYYNTTPEIKIVFDRFASMFSNGRFVHKRMDGTKDGKVIEDSEVVKFLENPNPLQSGEEWKIESALHYLIYGNRITFPVWGSSLSTIPTVMNNLPPDKIKVELTKKRWEQTKIEDIIEKYVLENYGDRTRDFKPNELIHHKNISAENPFLGISPLVALNMPITNIRGAYGFRNANINKRGALGFISNSSRDEIGSIAVSTDDRLSIEKQFSQETHGHFDGQSAIAISNNNLKFESTAYPMDKMMLFEEISEDMKKIIDMVGLNDNIFSKEKSKIQANLNEGLRMAYQDCIIPFASDFCSTMTKGLRLPDNEWLELDYSHIQALQKDELTHSRVMEIRTKAIKTLIDAGYSRKEAEDIILPE